MSNVSFGLPHGLQTPTTENNFTGIIVADAVEEEVTYLFRIRARYVYAKMEEILEQRKAKGDWSTWSTHPDYFKLKMKIVEAADRNPATHQTIIELN